MLSRRELDLYREVVKEIFALSSARSGVHCSVMQVHGLYVVACARRRIRGLYTGYVLSFCLYGSKSPQTDQRAITCIPNVFPLEI